MAQGAKENECITCNNFINNEFVAPKDGKYKDVICPRDGKVIGKVGVSSKEDVECAIKHAVEAYKKWSDMTVKQRMKPMFKLKELTEKNEETVAKIIMLEHGKNKHEALGCIRASIDTIAYACSMPQLISGKIQQVSNDVICKEFRMPHGVVASIVPFNFPLLAPIWTLVIAMAVGNCFIIKPSEKVPLTMNYYCTLMKIAGFPSGSFTLINGGVDTVNALIDSQDIKALSFIGSTKVASIVYNRCKAQKPIPKRCLCLGGAKNHLIAVNDCNIEKTANDIVNSFTGCSGQRCMAGSVLLLVGKQDNLLNTIVEKASKIVQGIEARNLGPVINEESLNRMHGYIETALKNGQKVLLDGREWSKDKKDGFWLGPTIILYDSAKHPGMIEEIFGPVLSVYICKDKLEAISIENSSIYGNGACIYTSTGATAEWFTKRLSAAMLGVNIGVPAPREPFSFGGVKASRFGDYDITCDGGIEFWTWRKKITQKWTPPNQEKLVG